MISSRKARLALTAGLVVVVLAGLGSLIGDPTESTFYVKIVNDTSRPVWIADCSGNRCVHRANPLKVRAGRVSGPEFASVGVANPVAIMGDHGQLVGCLQLKFPKLEPNMRVLVSSLGAC